MEVIKYSDLFSDDISQGIEGLVKQIGSVKTSMESMIEEVKAKAQGLSEALAGTSSSTKGGRDNTQAQAAQAEALYASYNQLKDATKYLSEQMVALTKAEESNSKIVKALTTSNDQFANVLDRVKAEAELASAAIAKMGSNGNSAEVKQLTNTVKALEGQVKNLEKALAASNKSISNTGKHASNGGKELLSYSEAFKSLADTIDISKVNLDALNLSEKAQQQISKNGEIANKSLQGSYNQLAAQYNLVKTVLNAMSDEMVKNTDIGKQMEAEALRLRNAMKAYQESTGVATLSVGDYGKALNGLNIATMQVMREMPTLANSLHQFFIAISNNVPIFVDNFKRAQAELGGFTKAIGATLKVVFSWQTALLVILTILPKITKAIHDKKKAQEEANKETEKAVTYAELMADAEKARYSAIVNETVKLQFLTGVLRDQNRSMEDRIKASQLLKKEFKDELANFSAEEIAAGKATVAIDKLIDALVIQAQSKAYLNEIGNLSIKLYGLGIKRSKAQAQQRAEEAKMENLLTQATALRQKQQTEGASMSQEELRKQALEILILERAIKKQQNAIDKATESYLNYDRQMQEVENTKADITKRIKLAGLDIVDSNGNTIDSILEIPSYYNDALKAIIDGMEDGLQKELALLDYNFKVEREKRMEQQAELEEMLKKHQNNELELTKEQVARIKAELSNLALAMVAEEQNYLDARKRMLNAMFQPQEVEETDPEKELIDSIRMRLAVVKNYQDKVSAMNYTNDRAELMAREHTLAEEVALKDKYNEELIQHEKEYWENYLEEMRAEGLELTDEYKEIMDRIAQLTGKLPSTRTSTHKKRGSANYRNLTEVAFAMNPITGYKDENGVSRIKDEYLDFANSVNTALQTSIDYMDEWMDKRIEMAELAVEKAAEEADAAKTALDYEMQARANGYANNVELARKEYEEKKRIEQEAIAEQKRLQKIQEGINTAQQIGALVTATANLWSGYSEIPIVGPALAIAATALMWGSFLAAKIQAANLANAETHGEGMAEYLDYGGSHASGHDIDFGRTKDGRKRRVEKGEVVGVIRKDKVQKYGVDRVLDIIKSLNNGTYDDHSRVITSEELINNVFGETPESRANLAFLNAKVEDMLRGAESGSMGLKMPFMDKSEGLAANYSSAFDGLKGATDLSLLERGVGELIKQGEVRVVQTAEGRIEYRGNNKRIIRNG